MELVVYGIPTCDTCRRARAFLAARGAAHRWVDLRVDPPARARIAAWVRALGSRPLRNTSGASYRALGARKDELDDAGWVAAFAADPMLLKRPVLERDGAAVAAGFDAERWAALLAP